MRVFEHLHELAALVGHPLATSEWIAIEQPRVHAFAEATDDRQWIHLDAERAAAGPFGTTIAHGFLTLSLLPRFLETAFRIADARMTVNYGLNRVRFPAPVPVGSQLRGHLRLLAWDAVEGGAQLTIEASIEREGSGKPVCVAEALLRSYT
jgi:acyl dehydratase